MNNFLNIKDTYAFSNISEKMRKVLTEQYVMENETPEELFTRVVKYGSTYHNIYNQELSKRLASYIDRKWFLPATPILLNLGAIINNKLRGYPISCFLNEMQDDMDSINDTFGQNFKLSSGGGGIATSYNNIRPKGAIIRGNNVSTGVLPWMGMQNSAVNAVSQSRQRKGSTAAYLRFDHPEIEEFIGSFLLGTNSDPRLTFKDLFGGVTITDKFFECLRAKKPWDLIDHKGNIVKSLDPHYLYGKLLSARHERGFPYIIFIDTVNKNKPDIYKRMNIDVTTSNLCTEIVLNTTGKNTGVCCLSSLNIEFFDDWKDDKYFISDVITFLDNVLEHFIENATHYHYKNAVKSAIHERSIGLGAMGYHSYLQKNMIAFEDAEEINKKIFSHIKDECDKTNDNLADIRGACIYGQMTGIKKRFTHVTAIAPTATLSILAETSPSIEPYNNNIYKEKTQNGTTTVKNPILVKKLESLGLNNNAIWSKIIFNKGSLNGISEIPEDVQRVFKTAFEIDQKAIIKQAGDRQKYIDQAQSLNIFVRSIMEFSEFRSLHTFAWANNVKSLYYARSESVDPKKLLCQDCE